jgi:hypothetical protein
MASAPPAFEISRQTAGALSYIVAYDAPLAANAPTVVAEIELPAAAVARALRLDVNADTTLLGDRGGLQKATVAGGTLQVRGTVVANGTTHDISPRIR